MVHPMEADSQPEQEPPGTVVTFEDSALVCLESQPPDSDNQPSVALTSEKAPTVVDTSHHGSNLDFHSKLKLPPAENGSLIKMSNKPEIASSSTEKVGMSAKARKAPALRNATTTTIRIKVGIKISTEEQIPITFLGSNAFKFFLEALLVAQDAREDPNI